MTELWYPPEADGSPAIVGPGGWHETRGGPEHIDWNAEVEYLLRGNRSLRSDQTHTRTCHEITWIDPDGDSGFDVVAYRLACPEARRLEKRVAELEDWQDRALRLHATLQRHWTGDTQ